MAERSPGGRTPDAGALLGRGDAEIRDFLRDQQAAADLADFALQATKPGSQAGALFVPGTETPLDTQLPLDAAASNGGWAINSGSPTVTVDLSVVDPTGAGSSLHVNGGGAVVGPLIDVSALTVVHAYGGATFGAGTGPLEINIQWFDVNGAFISDTDLGAINIAVAGTWYHFDTYLTVPTGATQCWYIMSTGAGDAYLNNFSIVAPSTFSALHTGRVSQGAAWWEPWGYVTHMVSQFNQTGISGEVDITAGSGPIIVWEVNFTPIQNRLYKVRAFLPVSATVADSTARVKLVDIANNQKAFGQVTCHVAASGYHVVVEEPPQTFPAGVAVERHLRATLQAGSGTISVPCSGSEQGFIEVYDVGPSGLPPEGLL